MKRLDMAAKAPIFELMGYEPHDIQSLVHADLSDTVLVAGGWRAGKSVTLAAEITPHLLIPSPVEYLVVLIGPTYEEPRAEFEYIVHFLTTMLPKHQFDPKIDANMPHDGQCRLRIRGREGVNFARLETRTAAEVERIRSFNAELVGICEAGGISEEGFFNIMGRVLSTGGAVIGTGTLERSMKWYHDAIKEGLTPNPDAEHQIHAYSQPSWSNTTMFPGGREDPKIKRLEELLPADYFGIRIAALPIRLTGVCIREASRERNVTEDAEYIPGIPVELAIDPGYSGAYAVLALQQLEGRIHVIDEVYLQFQTTDQVIAVCREQIWWKDIDPGNPGVIDRAAKQHQAMDSVLERWYEFTEEKEGGFWLDLTEGIIQVEDEIEQLNLHAKLGTVLVHPRCVGLLAEWDLGHAPETIQGFDAWQYVSDKEGRITSEKRTKGANHASTALAYWLVHRFGYVSPDVLEYGHQALRPMVPDYSSDRGVTVDPRSR